ncbi:MAG: acetate kinase [Spirochaetia bacterium]|nr:acetate kinase [Spirochaetia bacterium]
MVIMTLNCGSSSVKYQVYDWENRDVLAVGIVERIGQELSPIKHKYNGEKIRVDFSCPTHKEAIVKILSMVTDTQHGVLDDISKIKAVGHRVVHGGEIFKQSIIITDKAMKTFESMVHLAPLHMPANIVGIKAAQLILPEVAHCAIMDTAWHQTMPKEAFLYAVPYEWYKNNNVRRFGFHGTSYIYTAKRAAALLGKDALDTNIIIAHIGNGASICAVKNGVSIDTSMGLTPLEGLIMGTRSGDLDPAIIPFMINTADMTAQEMDTALNKKSGLLGITGKYSDRRDIRDKAAAGDELCQLAIDMESYRIKKYIGAYAAAIGKVDAVVFTAGVGEMAPHIRIKALSDLENIGICIDPDKNDKAKCQNAELEISTEDSPVIIFVIPTDEELVMTEDTYALIIGTYDIHTNFTYSFQSRTYVNKARKAAFARDMVKLPYLKDLVVYPPAESD